MPAAGGEEVTPSDRLQAWWDEYTNVHDRLDNVSQDTYERLTDASRAILEAGLLGRATVENGHIKGSYVELPFGLMALALAEVETEAVMAVVGNLLSSSTQVGGKHVK
jgi:hypothetical protein